MGRRKRAYLDDDISDSSNGSDNEDQQLGDNDDPDLRAERELFQDPYQRKRRRRNGKDDAIYGVLGDDDEDEGFGGGKRGGIGTRTRVNMNK